ncbi:hypothetical protein DPMN_025434 [Dreissena polymorpha]|uniref:Uncharacterized protein n=1 Tax=Dreissena polymorpha TaxID=45954 RepID=A0A9D4LRH7_DREPO|nr:hypothetical protein DPMN_025434 [Dreissena polymorpha]
MILKSHNEQHSYCPDKISGQTDRQTDQQSDSYIALITNGNGGITIAKSFMTINVASGVLTRKCPAPWWSCFLTPCLLTNWNHLTFRVLTSHIKKNALPPGGHILELIQDIIKKNYRTINVASRVLTRQMLTPHNRQKGITKAHHENIMLR